MSRLQTYFVIGRVVKVFGQPLHPVDTLALLLRLRYLSLLFLSMVHYFKEPLEYDRATSSRIQMWLSISSRRFQNDGYMLNAHSPRYQYCLRDLRRSVLANTVVALLAISAIADTSRPCFHTFPPKWLDFCSMTPIWVGDSGCQGVCNPIVTGARLIAHCSHSKSPFNMNYGTNIFATYLSCPRNGANVVLQDITRWPVMTEGIFYLGVPYKSTTDCEGSLEVRNCSFRPATVSYLFSSMAILPPILWPKTRPLSIKLL